MPSVPSFLLQDRRRAAFRRRVCAFMVIRDQCLITLASLSAADLRILC
jgi:hypothetical protein